MNNQSLGNQTISCNVTSCDYNDNAYCSLRNIQVAPCKNGHNGNPDDESMCASYQSNG